MPATPRPSARLPKAARQAAIANYLVQGYSLPRIADTLGYSIRHITRDLKEMEARFLQQAAQDLRFAKGLDLERLDALLSFLWPQCEQGHIPSIRAATELIAHRAKLLSSDPPPQATPIRYDPQIPLSQITGLTDAEAIAIHRQIMASMPQA